MHLMSSRGFVIRRIRGFVSDDMIEGVCIYVYLPSGGCGSLRLLGVCIVFLKLSKTDSIVILRFQFANAGRSFSTAPD